MVSVEKEIQTLDKMLLVNMRYFAAKQETYGNRIMMPHIRRTLGIPVSRSLGALTRIYNLIWLSSNENLSENYLR